MTIDLSDDEVAALSDLNLIEEVCCLDSMDGSDWQFTAQSIHDQGLDECQKTLVTVLALEKAVIVVREYLPHLRRLFSLDPPGRHKSWLLGGMQSDKDITQPAQGRHKRKKAVSDSESEAHHILEAAGDDSELGKARATSSQGCETTQCHSSGTGTMALELLSPLRSPILNPSNTTRYLGGLLQALHQAASFEALVQKHASSISCGPDCAWCLLREASLGTQDQQGGYDPQNWSKFFNRLDRSLAPGLQWHFGSQQHDSMEALPAILQERSPMGCSLL